MSFDAFICYKRLTAQDFAEALKNFLEESGIHAFLDVKDAPKEIKGTEEWTRIRDKAVIESQLFALIITPNFNLSQEIKNEISLARKYDDKKFVYFRHDSMSPNQKIVINSEELDFGKQNQIAFHTGNELVREAYVHLVSKKEDIRLNKNVKNPSIQKIRGSISNFAAFYGEVYGNRKIWKLYPIFFNKEEQKSMDKPEQICRVLETYIGNKAQLKQALQNIIKNHRNYSLQKLSALRDIVIDLGFFVNDDLSLKDN